MTDRELMQDALDAMLAAIEAGDWHVDGACDPDMVIERLRARLAQPEPEPEPEPVAWKDAPSKIYLQVCEESNCDQPFDSHIEISWCQDKINDSDISYVRADIAPPQRKWKGLTYEEFNYAVDGLEDLEDCWTAIESALKEKNGF